MVVELRASEIKISGEKFRLLRDGSIYSVPEFAAKLGIPPPSVERYETPRLHNVRKRRLIQIAKGLGITYEALIEKIASPPTKDSSTVPPQAIEGTAGGAGAAASPAPLSPDLAASLAQLERAAASRGTTASVLLEQLLKGVDQLHPIPLSAPGDPEAGPESDVQRVDKRKLKQRHPRLQPRTRRDQE